MCNQESVVKKKRTSLKVQGVTKKCKSALHSSPVPVITTPQHRNETVMWFGRSNKSKPSHA